MAWPKKSKSSQPKTYTSIGDAPVDAACRQLGLQMQRACAVLTEYTHTFDQTLEMLFEPSDLAKAYAAKGVVVDPASTVSLQNILPNVTLIMDFSKQKAVTLAAGPLRPQPGKIAPLLMYITEVEKIYLQYEAVKAMLRWLNRNATPGAIRYYWPTALKLCPDAYAFEDLTEVPSRYKEPQGINARLQLLRDTAATVAASTMLPEGEPRIRGAMWLMFQQRRVAISDEVYYNTDILTVNI